MAIDFAANMLGDTVGFLSTNVILTSTVKAVPGAPVDFQVRVPQFPSRVRYRTGSRFLGRGNAKATGLQYEARKWDEWCVENDTSEKVRVVWSGYAAGAPTHCQLDADGGPDIMFTPRLDGCSLTWGPLGGGTSFGHYNLLTDDKSGTVDQPDMVAEGQRQFGGDNFGIISKETYFNKAKRVSATTGDRRTMASAFGVRRGGIWKFYMQYMETEADGTLQLREAEELTAGTKYNVGI